MVIQLTHRGPVLQRGAAWQAAKQEFADRHCLVLPRFVEGALLDRALPLMDAGDTSEVKRLNAERRAALAAKRRGGRLLSHEVAVSYDAPVPRLFRMLLNNPRLFAPMQEFVEACADGFASRREPVDRRIRGFRGRFFKMLHGRPGQGPVTSWHSDASEGRQLALSINLSPDPAAAGGVEILNHESRRVHQCVPGFGDAVLFRIAPELSHRGLPPAGNAARCVFTGWFSSCASWRVEYVKRSKKQR